MLNFFVRGTPDGCWPTYLNLSLQGDQSICSSPNATEYVACPSGGYPPMWSSREGLFLYGKPAVPENYHRTITSDILFGGKSVIETLEDMLARHRYWAFIMLRPCSTPSCNMTSYSKPFPSHIIHLPRKPNIRTTALFQRIVIHDFQLPEFIVHKLRILHY
jgi:hypothetical protein